MSETATRSVVGSERSSGPAKFAVSWGCPSTQPGPGRCSLCWRRLPAQPCSGGISGNEDALYRSFQTAHAISKSRTAVLVPPSARLHASRQTRSYLVNVPPPRWRNVDGAHANQRSGPLDDPQLTTAGGSMRRRRPDDTPCLLYTSDAADE